MKTYCKGVNITSDEHLGFAYDEFARKNRRRKEFSEFFSWTREEVIEWARNIIVTRTLELPAITYFDRIEPTNGKMRTIARSSAKQQYLDYVAVLALHDLNEAKVGYHQCASVRGKGQKHARRYLQKWVRDKRSKYYIKLDITKFYPSVDRGVLFSLLAKDLRNDNLLWLIMALVSTHKVGLNIGSYLSQYLANYYLSSAYRYVLGLDRVRKSKSGPVRERLVDHVLTYMDDWALIGHDKANLKSAARKLGKFLDEVMHVRIKKWKLCVIDSEPLDMCGYVFRRTFTTIRAAIFRRARRSVLRARRAPSITPHIAARIISYWGYFKVTATGRFRKDTDLPLLFQLCRKVVSATTKGEHHEEDTGTCGAATCGLLAAA